MTVLDRGFAESGADQRDVRWRDHRDSAPNSGPKTGPTMPIQHPAIGPPPEFAAGRVAGTVLNPPGQESMADKVQLHQSVAQLLATRGQWQQAYEHLRHALDLITSGRAEPPRIPEQYHQEVLRLRREHAEAREQSIRDSLTASYNRRYLDQRLVEVVEQQSARAGGLAVALVDLDWFKRVNDSFGHLVGDRVLQRVVELLKQGLPEGGFCARYGGEEFVLVLPDLDEATAIVVAEAARARVEQYPWSTIVLGLRVTVSIGLAHESATERASGPRPANPEQQLRRADGLLYAAKQSGRNAVAYRSGGQTRLAGAAAGRRAISLRNDSTGKW